MKIKKTLKAIAGIIAILITFIIGWIDRIILVFLFWESIESITSEKYYRQHFQSSFVRVLIAGLIISIIYGVKILFQWLTK